MSTVTLPNGDTLKVVSLSVQLHRCGKTTVVLEAKNSTNTIEIFAEGLLETVLERYGLTLKEA